MCLDGCYTETEWRNQTHCRPPEIEQRLIPQNPPHTQPVRPLSKSQLNRPPHSSRNYRYIRAITGFQVSGDTHKKIFDDITVDQPLVRCTEDSLLWDNNIKDKIWHTYIYLFIYLSLFTQDSHFNSVKLLSLRNTYNAVFSLFHHRGPHRGIELRIL